MHAHIAHRLAMQSRATKMSDTLLGHRASMTHGGTEQPGIWRAAVTLDQEHTHWALVAEWWSSYMENKNRHHVDHGKQTTQL